MGNSYQQFRKVMPASKKKGPALPIPAANKARSAGCAVRRRLPLNDCPKAGEGWPVEAVKTVGRHSSRACFHRDSEP